MTTQTRPHFIGEHECLIALDVNSFYDTIINDVFDTVEEAASFVHADLGGIEKLIRLDRVTGLSEDVSEQIAQAIIKLYGDDLSEEDEVDPFLENSDAWDEHITELAREAAEDARYGTYEEQHRLTLKDVL